MTDPSAPIDADLKYGVDRLVISDRRVFGWGWIADRTRRVSRVEVRIEGEGWHASLPVTFGLERPDVERAFPGWMNASRSGLVVTGYLPGSAPRSARLDLALEDGTALGIDITDSAEHRAGDGSPRRVLAWLLRAVWRRLRRGDVAGIVSRMKAQNYVARLLGESDLAEALEAQLGAAQQCIVLDHNMGGGANHYRRELIAERISDGFTVLCCTYNLPTLDYRLTVHRPDLEENVYRIRSFTVLERLLERGNVAEIFLNSPVSFDEPLMLADWLVRMRRRFPRVRLTMTAHDYFAVCPSFVLLDADGRYCGIPDVSECDACLKRHTASYVALSPPTQIGPWRSIWGNCLQAADEIRCFSESTRRLLVRAYPNLPTARLKVVPHRSDYQPERQPAVDPAGAPVIGILGQISAQKGAFIVRDLIEAIERDHPEVRVVVLGTLDLALQSRQLHVTGPYRREELVERIEQNGVNLLFFPSVWPETFSYVVSEMMSLGMPIVAFDLGAPAERLRDHARARLCPEVSAASALRTLLQLHHDLARQSPAGPALRLHG